MSRARTLAGAIGSDGALNVADVAGLAAVASSGSASDLSTGTLPNARLASGAAVANLGYTPVNKAGDTMTGSITKNLATGLGYTAGNYVVFDSLHQNSGSNEEYLTIMDYRNSNGSDWTTSGSRIQKKIDSTWMGYIEFNGGLSGGVSIGAGLATAGPNASGITRCLTVEGNGNVTVQNGNLVLASGKGIDFSANSNASGATSELLDDYEVGNFTPAWASGGSIPTNAPSEQTGRYVKIGRAVHFWIRIYMNSWGTGGSGAIRVSGLPFTATGVGSGNGMCHVTFTRSGGNLTWPTGATQVLGRVLPDTTLIEYFTLGNTTSMGEGATLNWSSDPQMYNNYISGTYYTAS